MEELLVVIFLLLGPILDVAGFYNLSINIVIRTLYLILIIYCMIRKKNNLKYLIILFIASLINFLFQYLYLKYCVIISISNTLKLFFLPYTILYFKSFKFKKYNKNKILFIILSAYIGIYLFSYISKIGADIYLESDGKSGYKGLFSSINEFCAIIVSLLPIVSDYLDNQKKYLMLIILFILAMICSLLIGTKILFFGVLFTIFYMFFKNRNMLFFKRSKKYKIYLLSTLIILLILLSFFFPKTRVYKNMQIQRNFFKIKNIISYEYLNKVVYNDRLDFLMINKEYYLESKTINKFLGIGFNNNDIKLIEIDIFDILVRYGIINLILFIFILMQVQLKKIKIIERLSLILIFLISLTSGHVLLNPNVCIYIGVFLAKNVE